MLLEKLTKNQLDELENIMRPDISSQEGFLNKSEDLMFVYKIDKQVVNASEITFEQISDKLETLVGKVKRLSWLDNFDWDKIEKGYIVEGKFKISFVSYRGYQHCPFNEIKKCSEDFEHSDSDYTIINLKTKKLIFFSALHIHLIRYHHFFEGHTKYRLDPLKCIEALELEPLISYKPVYKTQYVWNLSFGTHRPKINSIEDYLDDISSETIKKLIEEVLNEGIYLKNTEKMKVILYKDKLLSFSTDVKVLIIEADGIKINISHGLQLFKKSQFKYVEI